MFSKISQNSQQNTCARVSFLISGVFLWILRNFLEHIFLQSTFGWLLLKHWKSCFAHRTYFGAVLFSVYNFKGCYTEAVVQRCSVKKVFLKISQNIHRKRSVLWVQKNTLKAWNFTKYKPLHRCFDNNLQKNFRIDILRAILHRYFWELF